jgi:hypothetical protein
MAHGVRNSYDLLSGNSGDGNLSDIVAAIAMGININPKRKVGDGPSGKKLGDIKFGGPSGGYTFSGPSGGFTFGQATSSSTSDRPLRYYSYLLMLKD